MGYRPQKTLEIRCQVLKITYNFSCLKIVTILLKVLSIFPSFIGHDNH